MGLEKLEQALAYAERYEELVQETGEWLRARTNNPEFAIVLGSGLGDIANAIQNPTVIPYADIPNFPQLTVSGHAGKLVIGELEGVHIIGLQGRKHFYEVANEPFGTGMGQAVFPVHAVAEAGTKNYFATNAVGGLNLNYRVGDTMAIRTHINLLPNPLLGRVLSLKRLDGTPVWEFQPMNDAYDNDLRELLIKSAPDPARMHEGTYLAVSGRTYETIGESQAFRALRADAVGMSVAPEVIIARYRGMRAVGMSCITNTVDEDGVNNTNHQEVVAALTAPETTERLTNTVSNFFRSYKAKPI